MRKALLMTAALLLILCLPVWAGADKVIRVTFTGDCTIGSTERTRGMENSLDAYAMREGYDYFFRNFADMFAADDATVINFEGVLQDSRANENQNKVYRFRGPIEFTNIVTSVSIEAAALANNHVGDYGALGLDRTKEALANAGVSWFRIDRYYLLVKDGIRIAFFAIDSSSLQNNIDTIRSTMSYLKRNGQADACVVCYHGGTEYDPKHNVYQTRTAERLIDSGADLIIMHHPHVVQGIGMYRNRYICYSLGNFVFGGNCEIRTEMWRGHRPVTSLYAIVVQAEFTFSDDGKYLGQRLLVYPTFISGSAPHNDYQPRLVTGEDAALVLTDVQFDTAFRLPEFNEETGCVELVYLPVGEPIELPPLATPKPAPGDTGPVATPVPTPTPTPENTGKPGTLDLVEQPLMTREPEPLPSGDE